MPQHYILLLITYFYLFTLVTIRSQSAFLSNICKSVDPRSFASDHHYRMSNYSKSPFYLIQSSNHYEPHRPILVELGGASFRGFLLVAVDPLTGARIGRWQEMARGTSVLPCSAIIHSDYRIKKHALLVWQPPPRVSSGYVAFEATVYGADNRFIVGQVSVLPHQLYTHYQMNPVYERISPLESTKAPALSINPSTLFSVDNKQHPSSLSFTATQPTRREHTLGDILAQSSHITSGAILGQNSVESGETRRDWEGIIKTISPIERQLAKCDQQQHSQALLPSAELDADKHLFQFYLPPNIVRH